MLTADGLYRLDFIDSSGNVQSALPHDPPVGWSVKIRDYCGNETAVEVPAVLNGFPVTAIGWPGFSCNETLTSVALPEGITVIEDSAFCGCIRLARVLLPDSLKTIEAGAFCSCERLTEIVLPNGLTYIPDHAFADCKRLARIVLPSSVTAISETAFDGCASLTDVIRLKNSPADKAHPLSPSP